MRHAQAHLPPHVSLVRARKWALERLRSGLAASSPYLLGAFSYADIATASLIQAIAPVDDRHMRIGPATRATWTNASLAAGYADLVAWRDRLYDAHRRPATA